MDKTYFNVNQISTVRKCEKLKHDDLFYDAGWSRWIFKKEAGFYYRGIRSDIRVDISDYKNAVVENNTVYHKPHLEITMTNGKTYNQWYDSLEDLESDLNMLLTDNGIIFI